MAKVVTVQHAVQEEQMGGPNRVLARVTWLGASNYGVHLPVASRLQVTPGVLRMTADLSGGPQSREL
jgi:hypothetical protein